MKKLLLILLFCPLASFSQWTIVGSPINGEATQDWSGQSISLSTDGNVVAVGAPNNDDNGADSGHVRVYQNISGTWTQIGNDIDGEAAGDNSSSSSVGGFESVALSLNFDGSIVAIGAHYNDGNGGNSGHVRVFENISGAWIQVGQDIDGTAVSQWTGGSVSLSSNGNIVAIGAPLSSGGFARVYENISGTWTQLGADITAEASGDWFGGSISINANGNVVAIGGKNNDGSGTNAGHVRIFSYTAGQSRGIQATWVQIGSDIDGEAAGDNFGASVSLNAVGNIVVIGAKFNTNNGAGSNSGHVRVYESISGTWTQIGLDIDSSAQGDEFGYSVSINADGTRVAAGARLNDDGGSFNAIGHVRIFDNISGVWTQVHSEIIGAAVGNEFGTSVSISGDGAMVVIGAPRNAANGINAGQARIYQDPLLNVSDNTVDKQLVIYPNPVNNSFKIETIAQIDSIEIMNISGQIVKSFNKALISYNIEELSIGMYFVRINSENGTITKKLMKE